MNKLWVLGSTSQSISIYAVSNTDISDLEFTAHYADTLSNAFQEKSSTGSFNTTSTTAVSAPLNGYSRVIRNFTVFNPNAIDVLVKINMVNSGTIYCLDTFTLGTLESYSSNGCMTYDGKLKFSA